MFVISIIPAIVLVFTRAAIAQDNTAAPTKTIPAIENISEPLRDNLLPLTTTFTPAAACLSDLYIWARTWTNPWEAPGCHPGQATTTYSPGLCYAGYEAALSQTNVFSGITETIIHCCPSGMNIDLKLGCSSSINGAVTRTSPSLLVSSLDHKTTLYKTLIWVADKSSVWSTTSNKSTELTEGNFYAPSVQVRFQSSDTEIAQSWSSILAAYAASNGSTGSGTGLNESSGQASVGPAMIAAIVLGALIALAVLCGIALIILHRHKKSRDRQEVSHDGFMLQDAKQGVGLDYGKHAVAVEADAHPDAREMMQCDSPRELPADAATPIQSR